jgi:hypothetical protein
MAPLSVHFRTTAPYTNRFEWSFTNPSLNYAKQEPGNYTGMIFEKSGTYTVTLKEYAQSTGALIATTSTQISVTPFIGSTFYIDGVSGNDAAAGTTPATAWRTPARFNSHLNALPIAQRRNITLLFKRGQTFQRAEGSTSAYIVLHTAERIRIGAYANPDGSDNAGLPKPILKDSVGADCGPTSGGQLLYTTLSKDILVQDIEFKGNYKHEFGDARCDWGNPYETGAIAAMNTTEIAVNRVMISGLSGGVYVQKFGNDIPEVRGWLIQNSEIRNTWGVHLFGEANGVAIKDSIFENSAISHITYFGVSKAGIVRNVFSGSGLRLPENWHACVVRLNETLGDIFLHGNTIKNAAGTPICSGRNYMGVAASNVMIDGNRIEGGSLPGQYFIPFFSTATLALQNSTVRNNVIVHPRGPIQVGGGSTIAVGNISFEHNTFVTNARLEWRSILEVTRQYDYAASVWTTNVTGNIKFKNNIVRGPSGAAISLKSGTQNLPGYEFSNNVYHRTNGAPEFEIENGLNNYQNLSLAQWRALGRDQNSITLDPQFESLDPTSVRFARPIANSPVVNIGQGLGPVSDALGRPRVASGGADVGAYEFFTQPTLAVSQSNPGLNDTITLTVNAPLSFAGRDVSILASSSGTAPGFMVPFENGLFSIPLNLDQSFINALGLLTGKINSSGQFVVQTTLASLGVTSASPMQLRAVVYEIRRFVIDDISNSLVVTPSGGSSFMGGGESGGNSGSVGATPKKKITKKKLTKKQIARKKKAAKRALKRKQKNNVTPPPAQEQIKCCPRDAIEQDSLMCKLGLYC